MATTVVNIIPTIRACAAPTIESRIAAIKRFFGGPLWLRNITAKKPLTESEIISKVTEGKMSPNQARVALGLIPIGSKTDVRYAPAQSATEQFISDAATIVSVATSKLPNSPVKFLQDVSAPTQRDRNLLALMEVTRLSKAQKPTHKDLIFKMVESKGSFGATAEEICASFPDVAYKGLTSRVSEMVKAGVLSVSGKRYGSRGVEVSVYVISLAKEGK